MTNDVDELKQGLADWQRREAEMRNAVKPTPIPPAMLDEKCHESVRQEAENQYLNAIMKKQSSQWNAQEERYVRVSLAQWSQGNRR